MVVLMMDTLRQNAKEIELKKQVLVIIVYALMDHHWDNLQL